MPVALAVRQTLGSVAFSNALPFWAEPIGIDFDRRERQLDTHIAGLLDGKASAPVVEVPVPRRGGGTTTWLLPSVDDQIALQAAVAGTAEDLERTVDRDHVFSYRPNDDPATVAQTRDQVESWQQFQDATAARLKSSGYMLQLDLERAFDSISRSAVIEFVESRVAPSRARDLLVRFIEHLSTPNGGLAHVNDSLFVVGNAYLSEIDRLVRARTPEFIRFVDDYRIFGASRDELERILVRVSHDIEVAGFTLNVSKLRLGSAQEYFDAIARPQYTPVDDANEYISARVFKDVLPADFVIALVDRVVRQPNDYLNDGFGRLVLTAVRKMRIDGALAERMGAYGQLSDFRDHLANKDDLVAALCTLLAESAPVAQRTWAAVWAAFVLRDVVVDPAQKKTSAFDAVDALVDRQDVPMLVRLWAAAVTRSTAGTTAHSPEQRVDIEQLHRAGYLEAGRLAYGNIVHA
jgi:hypothetical protein